VIVAEKRERGLGTRPARSGDQRILMGGRVFVEQIAVCEPRRRQLFRLLLGDQLAEQRVVAKLPQRVLVEQAQSRDGGKRLRMRQWQLRQRNPRGRVGLGSGSANDRDLYGSEVGLEVELGL